jgi:hypothetical protein
MTRFATSFAAALGAIALFAGAAQADVLKVYDQSGAEKSVDTSALSGCSLVFDSKGLPFQICKMEKIEINPPSSTRARPGGEARVAESQVVYKRTE